MNDSPVGCQSRDRARPQAGESTIPHQDPLPQGGGILFSGHRRRPARGKKAVNAALRNRRLRHFQARLLACNRLPGYNRAIKG